MLLIERSSELAGTRGGMAYTLRFAAEDLDLLVRAGGANEDHHAPGRLDRAARPRHRPRQPGGADDADLGGQIDDRGASSWGTSRRACTACG